MQTRGHATFPQIFLLHISGFCCNLPNYQFPKIKNHFQIFNLFNEYFNYLKKNEKDMPIWFSPIFFSSFWNGSIFSACLISMSNSNWNNLMCLKHCVRWTSFNCIFLSNIHTEKILTFHILIQYEYWVILLLFSVFV